MAMNVWENKFFLSSNAVAAPIECLILVSPGSSAGQSHVMFYANRNNKFFKTNNSLTKLMSVFGKSGKGSVSWWLINTNVNIKINIGIKRERNKWAISKPHMKQFGKHSSKHIYLMPVLTFSVIWGIRVEISKYYKIQVKWILELLLYDLYELHSYKVRTSCSLKSWQTYFS